MQITQSFDDLNRKRMVAEESNYQTKKKSNPIRKGLGCSKALANTLSKAFIAAIKRYLKRMNLEIERQYGTW